MLALSYNIGVSTSNKLITHDRLELTKDHHSAGSGSHKEAGHVWDADPKAFKPISSEEEKKTSIRSGK